MKKMMNTISTQYAQDRLSEILGEISQTHVPVEINDERYPGVLVSAEDWRSIQETLYLLSVPEDAGPNVKNAGC